MAGEYIPQNFLLTSRGDDWQLAGLIDFGDVQTCIPDWQDKADDLLQLQEFDLAVGSRMTTS
jgi:hypothetical protein